MKNNKKIMSIIAALALSSTLVVGATALAGCGEKAETNIPETTNTQTLVKTAIGDVVYNVAEGNTYYASPDAAPAVAHDGTKEDPFYLPTILTATSSSNKYLAPGDTLLLLPGTTGVYNISNVTTMTTSGAYNKYIRIMNATLVDDTMEEQEIVLDFSAQNFSSANRGIQIYGNYIYWYGIDVRGAGDNGMYIGGSYNTVEYSDFYDNRDTGLQLGRAYSAFTTIDRWPSYNLVLNCTAHNNYDNHTYGENADGFAAKLTVGYGNVFDGCIAYRNSDDGWDLFAKSDSGNIGTVILYNCVAFENGFLEYTKKECNDKFGSTYDHIYDEEVVDSYITRDGDGNGYKLGGSTMEGDSVLVNCLTFNNRMHGVTDNSNPGVITLNGVTSYDNSAAIDDVATSATFGQIIQGDTKDRDKHGNVDVSRQTYSYNNLNGVLSVKSAIGNGLDVDAYRASVANSYLLDSTKANKITTYIDADSKNGIAGESVTALVAADVFTQLPIVLNGTTYSFNFTGLEDMDNTDGKVHLRCRNADGSINMGGLLDVKVDNLLGNGAAIGSDLNKTTYAEYPHFYTLQADSSTTSDASIVAKVKEALIIPTDTQAVYQDFQVPATMSSIFVAQEDAAQANFVNISWASSNTDIVSIDMTKIDNDSLSGSTYYTAVVVRPVTEDTQVTLTATMTYGTATETKTFTLNIKKAEPSVGDITLLTEDEEIVFDGDSIIIDRFDVYQLPTLFVENGMDYNGKLLDSSLYDVKMTYKYAVNSSAHLVEVRGLTTSNAGVYEITYSVKLKTDTEYTSANSITISVFVASTTSTVDFDGDAVLTVNKEGYIINGNVTSATGSLYIVTSPTALTDLTKDNIATYTNVEKHDFRATSLSLQFTNANTSGYYVYYALGNVSGTITSELYAKQVSVVDIDTTDKFNTMAKGTAISGESTSSTIYRLTQDLDFADYAWTIGSESFTGLFNGMGHTISNISMTSADAAIFYKVDGGTIMNVKFNEITLAGTNRGTGMIRECVGGYFYNIAITNLSVTGANERIGGLIATIIQCNSPIYIEQVSLINDADHKILSTGQRVGGIIGFIQPSSSSSLDKLVEIHISNCYVNSTIQATQQAASFVGIYHANGMASLIPVSLSIDHCIAAGTVISTSNTSRIGGFIGYHTGSGSASLTNCLSLVTLNFDGADLTSCLKNASPIFGNYDTSAAVTARNLYGLMDEHNADYNVTALQLSYHILLKRTYFGDNRYLDLDTSRWTAVDDAEAGDTAVKAPYVTLNFLAV